MDIKDLYELLDKAEWVMEQLQLAVTRQTAFGPVYSAGGHGDSTPLYFNMNASVCYDNLNAAIVRLVARANNGVPSMSILEKGLIEWLKSHLASASECQEEISFLITTVSDGMMAIDIPRPRIYLGDCACGEKLYGDPEADEIECGRCACRYEPAVLREKNQKRGEDLIVTARDAHRYIGEVLGIELTPGRIRNWANRGQLEVRGSVPVPGSRQEASLYRLGDVIKVAREMSARNGDKSVRT